MMIRSQVKIVQTDQKSILFAQFNLPNEMMIGRFVEASQTKSSGEIFPTKVWIFFSGFSHPVLHWIFSLHCTAAHISFEILSHVLVHCLIQAVLERVCNQNKTENPSKDTLDQSENIAKCKTVQISKLCKV